jgi:uncharacterized Fe-S cluster-containing radical SAM superfamily protein
VKTGILDTERFSASLRRRGIDLDNRRILVTRFQHSDQAKDFTVPPNCAGFGRIHHFHRTQPAPWPENPLPIDPAALALDLPPSNILCTQVFQNAICSWRCWYCFVDFELLSANTKFSEFKSADELVDLYLTETDRPGVIDLSGGQPDLVPEWGLWFARALSRRNMLSSVYLWSDDNLSNDYLWRYLQPDEIQELAGLRNYGRVGCFKGFDAESFSFNTKADPKLFAEQFALMTRLVQAGFDVYGYVTLTTVVETGIEAKMAEFVDRLQQVHPNFPLRTVPLRISVFTPTQARLGPDQEKALDLQERAVVAWNYELRRRFSQGELLKNITTHALGNR